MILSRTLHHPADILPTTADETRHLQLLYPTSMHSASGHPRSLHGLHGHLSCSISGTTSHQAASSNLHQFNVINIYSFTFPIRCLQWQLSLRQVRLSTSSASPQFIVDAISLGGLDSPSPDRFCAATTRYKNPRMAIHNIVSPPLETNVRRRKLRSRPGLLRVLLCLLRPQLSPLRPELHQLLLWYFTRLS